MLRRDRKNESGSPVPHQTARVSISGLSPPQAVPISQVTSTEVSIVSLNSVVRRYGTGSAQVLALRGLDLEVREGEFVAILGRSGAGKSTLMNLLAGLDCASEGSVEVAGERLDQLSASAMARFRATRIGVVFQSFQLLPGRTALENVELPLVLDGRPRTERRQAALDALTAVGLAERVGHTPGELSGGEQQRVAIARALVRDPALLLCDEPTGNLDSATADGVATLLRELHAGGRTIVMITHEQDLARRLATRLVTLADGAVASVEELER